MWMMTQHAFSSTVFKQVEPGWYMMRFRDPDSADWVCKLADIDPERVYEDMPSDYPLRLKISEDELVQYFLAEVRKVDYPNFKDRAKKVRGKVYAGALSSVWTAMLRLTPRYLSDKNWDAWDAYDRKHGFGKYRKDPKGSGSSVVYSSGRHPAASTEPAYADAEWWYQNFPPRDDHMDADADFTDLADDEEVEDLLSEVDILLGGHRSIHDLTTDEWEKLMEETPGGI